GEGGGGPGEKIGRERVGWEDTSRDRVPAPPKPEPPPRPRHRPYEDDRDRGPRRHERREDDREPPPRDRWEDEEPVRPRGTRFGLALVVSLGLSAALLGVIIPLMVMFMKPTKEKKPPDNPPGQQAPNWPQ